MGLVGPLSKLDKGRLNFISCDVEACVREREMWRDAVQTHLKIAQTFQEFTFISSNLFPVFLINFHDTFWSAVPAAAAGKTCSRLFYAFTFHMCSYQISYLV